MRKKYTLHADKCMLRVYFDRFKARRLKIEPGESVLRGCAPGHLPGSIQKYGKSGPAVVLFFKESAIQ